jgi:hypothetical protein
MNLDTYIKHIHQIFDESTICLKRILFWYRGSIILFFFLTKYTREYCFLLSCYFFNLQENMVF